MIGVLGRIGWLKIMVSPFLPDDTMIVNQKTFDHIKEDFPDARQDIKESAPQPTTEQSMPCSHIGTWVRGASVLRCAKCGVEYYD